MLSFFFNFQQFSIHSVAVGYLGILSCSHSLSRGCNLVLASNSTIYIWHFYQFWSIFYFTIFILKVVFLWLLFMLYIFALFFVCPSASLFVWYLFDLSVRFLFVNNFAPMASLILFNMKKQCRDYYYLKFIQYHVKFFLQKLHIHVTILIN